LKENEKNWKFETNKPKLKKKEEEKIKRLTLAKIQKEETLRKLKQKKISESWKMLPEHEKKKFLIEEEKQRRMELRELKVNIWKKWRSGKKKNDEEKGKNITLEDSRLEKLEEILEKMRAETQKRKDVKLEEEKRREKLLAENKLRQQKMLRQEQEKRDRVAKKRMLEERWEMARWISTYISENEEMERRLGQDDKV
jgi:hypothetical protein